MIFTCMYMYCCCMHKNSLRVFSWPLYGIVRYCMCVWVYRGREIPLYHKIYLTADLILSFFLPVGIFKLFIETINLV